MENNIEELCRNLKEYILLLNTIIISRLGNNPYKEIDKILSIINKRNYKQFHSIQKKIKELSILLYDRRLYDSEISNVLKRIESILCKFDKI